MINDTNYYHTLYCGYMLSDLGKMKCEKYDVLNGNIDEHLNLAACFIGMDLVGSLKINYDKIKSLSLIFEKVVVTYEKRFKDETGFEPGNMNYYNRVLDKCKEILGKPYEYYKDNDPLENLTKSFDGLFGKTFGKGIF